MRPKTTFLICGFVCCFGMAPANSQSPKKGENQQSSADYLSGNQSSRSYCRYFRMRYLTLEACLPSCTPCCGGEMYHRHWHNRPHQTRSGWGRPYPGQGRPPFDKLLNDSNIQVQAGALVVEPVCEGPVAQADAMAACRDFHSPVRIPTGSQQVKILGSFVLDTEPDHGWTEIHPVTSITTLRANKRESS